MSLGMLTFESKNIQPGQKEIGISASGMGFLPFEE